MMRPWILVLLSLMSFSSLGAKMEFKTYQLKNSSGMTVEVTNYGGRILSIQAPDKSGKFGNVVIGFDRPEEYTQENPYFGAIIGRVGNRIAKGRFTLNGKEYKLAINNGPNSLHGGLKGFDKVFWKVNEASPGKNLKLTYTSVDGEEGYPGNLNVEVSYSLSDDNELKIDYVAASDKATPVNLTNHSYFNLSNDRTDSILKHELMIEADRYTVVDKDLTPTGELRSVEGIMDFRKPRAFGTDIAKVEGGGYDHNYVLTSKDASLRRVASLHEPKSGRFMEVFTTEPGVQFYSGNFLDGTLKGQGVSWRKHAALCLETQHFPDSPNQKSFPSIILHPGKTYTSSTVYKFSVK